MFLSELSIFFVYMWGFKPRLTPDPKETKPDMPFKFLIFPVLFDLIATPLSYLSLALVPGSVYQMMKGLLVLVTAIYSIIFFKRRYHR